MNHTSTLRNVVANGETLLHKLCLIGLVFMLGSCVPQLEPLQKNVGQRAGREKPSEQASTQVSYKADCTTCGYEEGILFRECPNAKPDKNKISVFCCMECYSVWEAYKGEDGHIVPGKRHFASDKHEFIIDGEEYRLFEPEADWATQCNYPLLKLNAAPSERCCTLAKEAGKVSNSQLSTSSCRKRQSPERAEQGNGCEKKQHTCEAEKKRQ